MPVRPCVELLMNVHEEFDEAVGERDANSAWLCAPVQALPRILCAKLASAVESDCLY